MQAYIAYLAGIALPFPGFVGTLGASVSDSALHLGNLGWILSFSVSFVVYVALCTVWPTQNQKAVKEMGFKWEDASGDQFVAADGTVMVEQGDGVYEADEVVTQVEAPASEAKGYSY